MTRLCDCHSETKFTKTNFYIICILYLTIRLQARDFYAVMVDEGEARINYPA